MIIFFPLIKKLLLILGTLPISIASAEHSFSTLRRLKTWLRNQMSQAHLTGLALMNIHSNVPLDIDSIINRFAKSKYRTDFIL
ncbi:PREDICTED: zinc finger MYM-type protein 1-like [Diuraphis noxia]|uniref:zinc finger MYM-type protein 1-like n=1 Tax=Diuraphis noxia TaxID=143948 RepID=UPI0007637ABB|nr:PREDICTED: zinc finger MYM-type protein 1-like [Diuraphis noxia]